jgi:hypothetical protein
VIVSEVTESRIVLFAAIVVLDAGDLTDILYQSDREYNSV